MTNIHQTSSNNLNMSTKEDNAQTLINHYSTTSIDNDKTSINSNNHVISSNNNQTLSSTILNNKQSNTMTIDEQLNIIRLYFSHLVVNINNIYVFNANFFNTLVILIGYYNWYTTKDENNINIYFLMLVKRYIISKSRKIQQIKKTLSGHWMVYAKLIISCLHVEIVDKQFPYSNFYLSIGENVLITEVKKEIHASYKTHMFVDNKLKKKKQNQGIYLYIYLFFFIHMFIYFLFRLLLILLFFLY